MNLRQYLVYPDRRVSAQAAMGALLARAGTQFLRKRLPPSIPELASVTPRLHGDATRLLGCASWLELEDGHLTSLAEEHLRLRAVLEARRSFKSLVFPQSWAVEC